jgi:hypothetical protein
MRYIIIVMVVVLNVVVHIFKFYESMSGSHD